MEEILMFIKIFDTYKKTHNNKIKTKLLGCN